MRKGGRTTGLQQVAEGIDHWTEPSKLRARDSFPTGPCVSGLFLVHLAWSNNKWCSNSSWLNVAFKVNWHKQILIYDQKTKTLASWIYPSFIFVATFMADNSQDLLTDRFFSGPFILNDSNHSPRPSQLSWIELLDISWLSGPTDPLFPEMGHLVFIISWFTEALTSQQNTSMLTHFAFIWNPQTFLLNTKNI